MKKKTILVIICIVMTIFITSIIYVTVGANKAKRLINNYLDEKGYSQDEIQSIDVKHSFLNVILSYQEWSIAVVYSDEPTSIYYYHMNGDKISEGGVSGITNKEELKH